MSVLCNTDLQTQNYPNQNPNRLFVETECWFKFLYANAKAKATWKKKLYIW